LAESPEAGGTVTPALKSGTYTVAQLLDLAGRTVGEHADRTQTDHDLAGWWRSLSNLDPTPGEVLVNTLPP